MSEYTIGQLVNRFVEQNLYKDQKIYKDSDLRVSSPDTYMGIELEIENWPGGSSFPGFSVHGDNSLRNNGVEWITYPTKLRHMDALLTAFFNKFRLAPLNYSERCSTHVHVNVQDFTPKQLTTLVLLYQLFERLLFNFVEEGRRSNIFCVPWYQAGVTYELVDHIENWDAPHIHGWQKYTALNLLTIEQKGTVEYRHLEGTCDVKRIMTWCNLLGCMHAYAKSHSLDDVKNTIISLNTSSAYDVLLQDVFGEWTQVLQTGHHVIALEEGVLDCKYMLSQPIKAEPKKPKFIDPIATLRTARAAQPRVRVLGGFDPNLVVRNEQVRQLIAAQQADIRAVNDLAAQNVAPAWPARAAR